MHIAFAALLLRGQSGKRSFIIGKNSFDKKSVIPDFCAIFIIPLHIAIIPSIEIISVTASPAPVRIAEERLFILQVQTAQSMLTKIDIPQI